MSRVIASILLVAAVFVGARAQEECPPTYWVHGENGDATTPVLVFVPADWTTPEDLWSYRCAVGLIVEDLLATSPYDALRDRLRIARVDPTPQGSSDAPGDPVEDGCVGPFWNGVCTTEEQLGPFKAPEEKTVSEPGEAGLLPVFPYTCETSYAHGGILLGDVEGARRAGSCALSKVGLVPLLVVVLAKAGGMAGYAYAGEPRVAALTLGNIDKNSADLLAHELGHAFGLSDESGSVRCETGSETESGDAQASAAETEPPSEDEATLGICSRVNATRLDLCDTGRAPWSDCCTEPAANQRAIAGCVVAIDECVSGDEPSPEVGLYRIPSHLSGACTDCYRPSFECKMDDFADVFCVVCQTEIWRQLSLRGSDCLPLHCGHCVESDTYVLSYPAEGLESIWRIERIARSGRMPGLPPLPMPEILERLHVLAAYAEVDLGGVNAEIEVGALRFDGAGPRERAGPPLSIRRRAGFPYDRLRIYVDGRDRPTPRLKIVPPPSEVTNREGTERWIPRRVRIVGYLPVSKE